MSLRSSPWTYLRCSLNSTEKAGQGDSAFEGLWMMLWVNLKREDLPGGNYMVHEASETGMFFSRFQPSRPAIEFGPYPFFGNEKAIQVKGFIANRQSNIRVKPALIIGAKPRRGARN